jgi:hypothetical protein
MIRIGRSTTLFGKIEWESPKGWTPPRAGVLALAVRISMSRPPKITEFELPQKGTKMHKKTAQLFVSFRAFLWLTSSFLVLRASFRYGVAGSGSRGDFYTPRKWPKLLASFATPIQKRLRTESQDYSQARIFRIQAMAALAMRGCSTSGWPPITVFVASRFPSGETTTSRNSEAGRGASLDRSSGG